MAPLYFAQQTDFRNWLENNHNKQTELLVGFYKVGSGKPSMSWSEAVDEALCFGWIDGVRKSLGEESYCIRFTPRKPKSIWSAVNIRKVEELRRQGLMRAAGLAAFEKREEAKSKIYSYEKEAVRLDEQLEQAFKANEKAWTFFQRQPPSYQKRMTHWIMDAKQPSTQASRLEKLIAESEAERRV